MKRSPRTRLAATAIASVAAVLIAGCGGSSGGGGGGGGGGSAAAPGITKTEILIGSHQPLTGPAAPGYSEISAASNAYFQYVNANGGVYGRKIVYKYLDDGYDPSKTVSVVHQLVLQDNVFAIFNGLGTPTHLSVVNFLNASHVPDLFVASGCDCWDNPGQYPDTFGWQLDYIREGKILGKYIADHFKGQKVGYFYQNDEFGQDGIKGFSYEIPKSQVVDQQSYVPTNTNLTSQVASLKSHGVKVIAAYSIPAFTALLKLTALKLNYNPTIVVSSVGSDPLTLAGLLQTFAKKGGSFGEQLENGIISNGYLPPVSDLSNPWIALFKKIHDQYDAKAPFDGNVLYGEAVGYALVEAMFKAGKNPTRASVINALNGGMAPGPVVAPYGYSSSSHQGATGAYVGKIVNGALKKLTPVYVTDATQSGAITVYTGTPEQPSASGIPSSG